MLNRKMSFVLSMLLVLLLCTSCDNKTSNSSPSPSLSPTPTPTLGPDQFYLSEDVMKLAESAIEILDLYIKGEITAGKANSEVSDIYDDLEIIIKSERDKSDSIKLLALSTNILSINVNFLIGSSDLVKDSTYDLKKLIENAVVIDDN